MAIITKTFLPFLVFTSIVWSAPSADNHIKFGLFSRIHAFTAAQQKPNVLTKKAALQWKQTGTIQYYNSGYSGEDTTWEFSSRDTIIYDAAGHEIIRKTSNEESGWNNLESLDSNIYMNGKVAEEVSIYYSVNGSGISGGDRSTYNYLDGGKTIVIVEYDWGDSMSKWKPYFKDSVIFSTSIDNMSDPNNIDMHSFLKEYTFSYDSINSSWNSGGYFTKTDAECNSTTLVLSGNLNEDDSLVDYKEIMTFNSSFWNYSNLLEERSQEKNPDNGEYYDTYKSISFFDSHKNDSLDLYCEFNTNTQSWDTTSMSRYIRTYDANDNNINTFELDYDYDYDEWTYSNKDVNKFAQVNVPVIHPEKTIYRQNISVSQTAGFIRFSAPGITGLELYNIEGRQVASVKQNAATTVSLNLSDPHTKISSGSYIARLKCKEGINSFPLFIKR